MSLNMKLLILKIKITVLIVNWNWTEIKIIRIILYEMNKDIIFFTSKM